jgi:2-dehydropantoate 2-reductase
MPAKSPARAVTQTEIGMTWLGPYRGTLAEARRWGNLLAEADMAVEVLRDPRGAIWGKLILNAAVNPIPVLTGLRLSEVYAFPETYALLRTLVRKASRVTAALGIDLHADPMAVIDAHRALGPTHAHLGSMKQDIDRGRRTEIESLTGCANRRSQPPGSPGADPADGLPAGEGR